MTLFTKGQRWISEMEPELGLGTLMDVKGRMLRVHFKTSECIRQYAVASAPLKRISFLPGDRIVLKNQAAMHVESVEEVGNLLYYHGAGITVCEDELSDTMVFTNPQQRLGAGLVDSSGLFELRYQAHLARYRYRKSDIMGFTGARVELIPHQFYIAGEVASRHMPRVMLADETGLGKTIEACLILNRLLMSEQIHRVLILLPHSLVHQWFVELHRRFNLTFRIVDEAHCASLEAEDRSINPFLEDQLILCDMNYIVHNQKRAGQSIEAGWDMVIVDEAHHVDENTPAYSFLKSVSTSGTAISGRATSTPGPSASTSGIAAVNSGRGTGLMLLTATPEQLGIERHFAHLKLLDPLRYSTLEDYTRESEQYQKIAATIDKSVNKQKIRNLLDCYGPGRAVFRNTRSVIKGFPRRDGVLYPLDEGAENRIKWLVDLLKSFPNEKFLLICHAASTTVEIAEALKRRITLQVALFHENMTLIQRDRNAAWFSEKNGARLMLCSEIGSEGRNFQFARHLVMFDLPLNPELLEQRIGRLDRIGQTEDIVIHLPHARGTVQEILVRWYNSGTSIFQKNISGIHYIHRAFEKKLHELFQRCIKEKKIPHQDLETLIRETQIFSANLTETLARGKDRLLELNSFRIDPAQKLIREIENVDNDLTFDEFVLKLFDYFRIEAEDTGKRSHKLHFSDPDNIDIPLPAMKNNGMHITFDRKTAVTRDDMEFLSWDNPMVSGSMDLLLGSEQGNSSVAAISGTGTFAILLEAVHVLECVAPKNLNINRFLPSVPIRTVVNHGMEDLTERYSMESLKNSFINSPTISSAPWINEFPEIKAELLPRLIEASRSFARKQAVVLIENAKEMVVDKVGGEATRLIELKKKNPAVRGDEIEWAENQTDLYLKYLATAGIRLDALRLIKVE